MNLVRVDIQVEEIARFPRAGAEREAAIVRVVAADVVAGREVDEEARDAIDGQRLVGRPQSGTQMPQLRVAANALLGEDLGHWGLFFGYGLIDDLDIGSDLDRVGRLDGRRIGSAEKAQTR